MKPIILFLLFFSSYHCFGQQLVYRPINPAFGGDTFNHAWLLSAANAQNSFEDDKYDRLSGLDRLNRGLDGRFGSGFGSSGDVPPKGISTSGDFQYEVFESTGGLVINVLNVVTGEATQVIIPN